MFEGFATQDVATNGNHIFVRTAGAGEPLLLLHGYPQTGAMWHAVAPALAEQFTVVVPDLRGYGRSGKPAGGGDSSAYSKRTMAAEMVEVMRALGHTRFGVAGHDRGGRVAYRLAFDHPDVVTKLAILDIVPTYHMWQRMESRLGGLGGYHWYFLAQPEPLPEKLIAADPIYFLHNCLERWAGKGFQYAPEAMAEYERSFSDPGTIHGSCEDYRAGARIDVEIDTADYGVRKIRQPMLALWGGARGNRDDLPIWREWADDARGKALDCGHFLPEEDPKATTEALRDFFSGQ